MGTQNVDYLVALANWDDLADYAATKSCLIQWRNDDACDTPSTKTGVRFVEVFSEGVSPTCCFMLHQNFDNNLKCNVLFLVLFSVLKYSILQKFVHL